MDTFWVLPNETQVYTKTNTTGNSTTSTRQRKTPTALQNYFWNGNNVKIWGVKSKWGKNYPVNQNIISNKLIFLRLKEEISNGCFNRFKTVVILGRAESW